MSENLILENPVLTRIALQIILIDQIHLRILGLVEDPAHMGKNQPLRCTITECKVRRSSSAQGKTGLTGRAPGRQ